MFRAKHSIAITLILAVCLIGCGEKPAPEQDKHVEDQESKVTLSQEAREVSGIIVGTVKTRSLQPSFTFPGVVESTTKGKAIVTTPVAGRIVRIMTDLGNTVSANDVVAIIESSELAEAWASIAAAESNTSDAQARLALAEAETRLTKSHLDSAEGSLERMKQLAAAGAFSQAPLQAALNARNDAQSELLALESEHVTHKEQVRRLESLFKDGLVSKTDLDSAKLELEKDTIKLERAKSRLAIAKEAYTRENSIAEEGLLNAKELRVAESEVRSAKIEHERAIASESSAQASLKNATQSLVNAKSTYQAYASGGQGSVGTLKLLAPISGTVTQLNTTQGESIDRTGKLLVIEDLESVWITVSLPEEQTSLLKTSEAVTATSASAPGREFTGIVQIVGSRIDPDTRTLPVRCLISQASGVLKPEMFAQVRISVGESIDSLAVPITAIVSEDEHTFVFVVEGEGFVKREVQVGSEINGYLPVLSGLELNEQIAIEGVFIISSEIQKSELGGHDH